MYWHPGSLVAFSSSERIFSLKRTCFLVSMVTIIGTGREALSLARSAAEWKGLKAVAFRMQDATREALKNFFDSPGLAFMFRISRLSSAGNVPRKAA